MCFSRTDGLLFDSLSRPIELSKNDESLWSDKCDYYDPDKCSNLNPDQFNLIIMQLNIRSILAHQTKLAQLLQTMTDKKSRVDILLPCETFLTDKTSNLVNIPGYQIITNNRKISKGGGVAILVRNGIPYKKLPSLCHMIEKELESVYIDITTRGGRHIRVGSLYRAPNTETTKLKEHIESISLQTQSKPKLRLIEK